jgi:hypothetical protein
MPCSYRFVVFLIKNALPYCCITLLASVIPCLIQSQTLPDPQNASVSGYVIDAATKEPLVSAVVSLKALKIGTFTNKAGFYVLRHLPAGTHIVSITYLGYKREEIRVEVAASEVKKITVALASATTKSEEITVIADREVEKRSISISQVNVPMAQVKQLRFGGEADVFRTIQYLPGVLSSSQLSSGLYIRGGSPDQNLSLLDGMTVYNPSHLFGFISTFNTDGIKDVDVSRGGFGAEYGGRMSGVVSMTQKDGNRENVEGVGSLGVISSKISAQGPLNLLGEGSWFVGGRRSYFEVLRALLPASTREIIPSFGFYDVNAKITQSLSDNDKISLSGFLSADFLDFNQGAVDFRLNLGNRAASLRWTHVFGSNLFSTVTLSGSNYYNRYDAGISGAGLSSVNTINDYTLKADMEWFAQNDLTFKFGTEITNYGFGYLQYEGGPRSASAPPVQPVQNLNIDDWMYAVYAQGNYQLTDKASVQAGLRAYYLLQNGSFLLDPRLALRYHVTDGIALKAAWGVYHQYLRLGSSPDVAFFDTWLPTDASVQPSRAIQYILSIETKPFGADEPYRLNFDVYYKDLRNVNELNSANTRSRKVSEIFYVGDGYSYGAEVFFERNFGDFTGWIGYSYAWTGARFDSLNGGRLFNQRYDRRHDFKLVGSYRLEAWEFGGSFTFQSGQPYTGLGSRFYTAFPGQTDGNGVGVQAERNALRLPPTHQLNLNVSYLTTLFTLPLKLLLDIYNVYSRRDIWYRYYDTQGADTKVVDVLLLPIIPTIAVELKF